LTVGFEVRDGPVIGHPGVLVEFFAATIRKKRLTKIDKWHKITGTTAMKQWLATRGPLITCFTVYADFFSYHSGIYHHVSGARWL
jgi:hypothetical protein